MKPMNVARTYGAKVATAAASLAAGASAFAADPTDALAAIGGLTGSSAAYGPPLFGLAIAVVGIMIGVKWIKRGKGAA